jgi:hypothetical protein
MLYASGRVQAFHKTRHPDSDNQSCATLIPWPSTEVGIPILTQALLLYIVVRVQVAGEPAVERGALGRVSTGRGRPEGTHRLSRVHPGAILQVTPQHFPYTHFDILKHSEELSRGRGWRVI